MYCFVPVLESMCVFGYKGRSQLIAVTYIFSFRVEPVSDVGSCSEDDWITQWALVVLGDEERQVEDLIKEADPAVSTSTVK